MPLSGYHRDYLGSDGQYHYIRIGNVTGNKEYRMKKNDLLIENEYKHTDTNPRIEPLKLKIDSN